MSSLQPGWQPGESFQLEPIPLRSPHGLTPPHTRGEQSHPSPYSSRSPSQTSWTLNNDNESSSLAPELTHDSNDKRPFLPAPPSNEPTSYETQTAPWIPGIWTRLPMLAIIALVGAFACTAAAVGILVDSNGRPIQEWARGRSFAPSVYLSILSVVSNAFLAFALAEGLVISFWRTALRGCTMEELHQNWRCGESLVHAVMHGRKSGGRITALACIFYALSLLRGPLYQRASVIRANYGIDTSGTLQVQVAQKLPEGYAGVAKDARAMIYETARLTPVFTEIMQEYSQRTNISLSVAECGDSCITTVRGFGFDADCDVHRIPFTVPANGIYSEELFNTSVTLYRIPNSTAADSRTYMAGMLLNATYFQGDDTQKPDGTIMRRVTSHICRLRGGTTAYKIQLEKGAVTLFPRKEDKFIEAHNLSSPGTWGHDSIIGGFQYVGSYLFDASATLDYRSVSSSTSLSGSLSNQMVNTSNKDALFLTFFDPIPVMLDAFREIAFRTSLRAGHDNATATNATQHVAYIGKITKTVYVTDVRYAVSAVAVSLAGIGAVSVTFFGWWKFGRRVTMSPFEIAKAFEAPLLRSMGSNVPGHGDLGWNKQTRIRYGENADQVQQASGHRHRRLVIAPEERVRKPQSGVTYGI